MAHVETMKSVFATIMIVLAGLFAAISICRPAVLADNEFITGFVVHDALNIMAVIMTIAIASIATIHIWFNELETKHDAKVFGAARREINHDAFLLIWLFVGELFLLIVRSYFSGNATAISLFDSAALIVFLCSVLTLIDILYVVRALTPSGD
jgi:hypothetical protein